MLSWRIKEDNVVINDISITYKGSTSYWNGSIFQGVDDGVFKLIYKENNWWLNYQINMYQLFIITAIMSCGMGIFAQINGGNWWVGILMFWLCGANWIINLIRHGIVATDIATGINELLNGQTELPEQDKMTGKLKSWF